LDSVITQAAVGALGELIATAVAASAGRTWKSVKGKPEAQAVRAAVDTALRTALRDAALPAGTATDDAWLAEVAKIWRPAFTPQVSEELVACIGDPSRDRARVAHLASRALGRPAFSGQRIWSYFMLHAAGSGTRRGLPAESGTRVLNGDESDYTGARCTAQCPLVLS